MIKRLTLLLLLTLTAFPAFAQEDDPDVPKTPWQRFEQFRGPGDRKGKFSPWEFMKKEDEFITRHAKLTLVEANFVCPLIHKMKDEMRAIDRRIHHLTFQADNPNITEKASLAIIRKIHALEKEKLQVETDYHNKILKKMSPKEFLKVLAADNRFDRFILRNMFMQQNRPQQNNQKGNNDKNNK